MHVCLVRPPSIISAVSYIGSLTPPIGLAYLAGSLRAAGHRVTIVDGVGEDPMRAHPLPPDNLLVARGLDFDSVAARIPADCDLIGISVMFSSEWPSIRPLVRLIGQRFPHVPYVGGGEHFTAAAELSLGECPELQALVIGEGEETIVEIAAAVAANRPLAEVAGLVLRGADGGFVHTPRRGRIRAIDAIPEPAWDLVPLENYLSNGLTYGVARGRSMPMLASRGCPYQCTFCSNPAMWGTRWIARSPALLVDEIERYKRQYGIANVDFYDLTAIVKRAWILEFCKLLVERGVDITWQLPSGTRSEAIDREVAHWLYKAGCRNMNYAPESGSLRTLDAIRKRVDLDRLVASLKGCVAEGLNIKINVILGLPDETVGDMLKTQLFLVRLSWHGAHDVSVGAFAPYPGSELYGQLVRDGVIEHSDDYFRRLAYVDISQVRSYCRAISGPALKRWVWAAFAVFYGTNYLFRPWRVVRTLRNVLTNRHESRGEMALGQLLARLRLVKAAK